MLVGDVHQLYPIFSDGLSYECQWSSSNIEVATVDSNGLVTIIGSSSGEPVVISCTHEGITKYCTISVIEFIGITPTSDTINMTETVQYSVVFSDNNVYPVTWSVVQSDLGSINSTGLFTPINDGNVTIHATFSGVTRSATLTVSNPLIGVNPQTLEIVEGENGVITPVFIDGVSRTCIWTSSDESKMIVHDDGSVLAIDSGSVVISCSYHGVTFESHIDIDIVVIPFQMEVSIPSSNYSVSLNDYGTAERTIDWGDGTTVTTTEHTETHTYTTAGSYTIKILGTINVYVSNVNDSTSNLFISTPTIINKIISWGVVSPQLTYMFYGCTNLTEVSTWNGMENVGVAQALFKGCSALTTIPSTWEGLDSLHYAANMFYGCSSLTSIPNTWDGLNNLENSYYMFYNCSSLVNIPSSWNLLNSLRNAIAMFYNCSSLLEIPDNWIGLEYVTYINSMFRGCSSIVEIPSTWDNLCNNSKPYRELQYMFSGCTSLTTIPLSWTTLSSTITSVTLLFSECTSLSAIPMSWDGLDSITNMYGLYEATAITAIPPTWDHLGNVISMGYAFYRCSLLTNIPVSWTPLTSIQNMSCTFGGGVPLEAIPNSWEGLETLTDAVCMFGDMSYQIHPTFTQIPPTWTGLENVTNISSMFANCKSLQSIPPTWTGFEKVTSTTNMFLGCESLTSIPTSWVGLNSIVNTAGMFDNTGITQIPSTWTGLETVRVVGDEFGMFSRTAITTIPSAWTGLENVVQTASMFRLCDKLTAIPSTWTGLNNVTDMRDMFWECRILTAIPSTWTGLENVTTMGGYYDFPDNWIGGAFSGCVSLTSIPTSWSGLNSITNLTRAFYRCSSLVSIGVSDYSSLVNVTKTSYAFALDDHITSNIEDLYTYLNGKAIPVTNHGSTFNGCTLAGGYANIPADWK